MMKEEIAQLQRIERREQVDLEYLKNVVLSGFQSGELPPSSSMLAVLARLLQFSPAEVEGVKARAKPKRGALFGGFSGGLNVGPLFASLPGLSRS